MDLIQLGHKHGQWTKDFPRHLDSPRTLIMVFFKAEQAHLPLWKELQSSMPQSIIVGCSGAGEIKNTDLVDNEIMVTVCKFATTELKLAHVDLGHIPESDKAGEELANQLPKANLKAVFVLSDGLKVNGTALISGLKKILGDKISISGGLAGDGTNFKQTFVLIGDKSSAQGLCAVGFYGDEVHIVSAALGGWKPFGPLRKITKSNANVVYEFDHKPALALYKEFLGEQAKQLPASALMFPIHLISGPGHAQRDVVRTILAVDEATQSMTFAGDVPEATSVQLMRASQENLIDAATEVASGKSQQLMSHLPALSLIVSCVGRRLVLGENTEGEIESVFEQLPKGSVQTGFYSYGELAPGQAGFCDLHNQTMTVTFIQEKQKG